MNIDVGFVHTHPPSLDPPILHKSTANMIGSREIFIFNNAPVSWEHRVRGASTTKTQRKPGPMFWFRALA